MNYQRGISNNNIEEFSKNHNGRMENTIISNAIIKNGLDSTSINNQSIINMAFTFSNEIQAGTVTNQKKSGRCWMFAGLNILRVEAMKKCNLENFELSEVYGIFWDKFEKFNYFLENIIDTIDDSIDCRTVEYLLNCGVQEGGDWNMFCNIIKKYGAVPKNIMPETFHSSDSGVMNKTINEKARKCACELRNMKNNGSSLEEIKKAKYEMLNEFYSMLCMFFGEPPKNFNFEYKDKDKKFNSDYNLTPLDFYNKYIGINLDDYVCIINCPTEDKPFNKVYNVKFLQNMVDGQESNYLNVDINTFKNLVVEQIKNGEPVWFSCDVGEQMNREKGIMDTDLLNYAKVLNVSFEMKKGDRINYRQICPTHAMLFTGVNIVNGKPNRYKVENSWGEDNGEKGFFIMSDNWFDEYMFEAVINKKYIANEIKDLYKQQPTELPPWDVLSLQK